MLLQGLTGKRLSKFMYAYDALILTLLVFAFLVGCLVTSWALNIGVSVTLLLSQVL